MLVNAWLQSCRSAVSSQAPAGGIRLLKKNEDANSLVPSQNTANKVHVSYFNLLHSLSFVRFTHIELVDSQRSESC